MAVSTDITYTRHSLSKHFPDTHTRSYIEGSRLSFSGGTQTATLTFNYPAILRKVAITATGSADGDYVNISGSNRTMPYATNIYMPPPGLGLSLALDLGESFQATTGNSVYLTYVPAGNNTNSVYIYWSFYRD